LLKIPKEIILKESEAKHYQLGLVLASNHEKVAGVVSQLVWGKRCVCPCLSPLRQQEAVRAAIEITKCLGLDPELGFFVRAVEDGLRLPRIIVCVVVASLARIKKNDLVVVSRVDFPLADNPKSRDSILRALQTLLQGQGISK
jgi:hypothetical protein